MNANVISYEEKYSLFSNKLRFLNLFFVLTIVSHHVSYMAGGTDKIIALMRNAGGGAMAWFFFSSAFWYFGDYSFENAETRIRKRISTLVVPYMFWNCIKILFITKLDFTQGFLTGMKQFFDSFFFIYYDEENVMMPASAPLWYIVRLMSYFLIAPSLYLILKNKKLGLISIVIAFFMTKDGAYYSFSGWLVIFMLGAFTAIHYKKKFVELLTRFCIGGGKYHIVGTIGFFIVYAAVSVLWLWFSSLSIPICRGCVYLIGLLMALVPILFFKVVNAKSVAAYSFVIYCSHDTLIYALNPLICALNRYIAFDYGVHGILLMLSILIVCVGGCKLLSKYWKQGYVFLTGGR